MRSHGHEERHGDGPRQDATEPRGEVRPLSREDATSEERLEALLAERRRELEAHARRLEETVSDVERREGHVRDARISVERVLRVGAADLEAREADLADLSHELEAREARIREQEAALAHRRSELGAVELKRAAIELREQAVATREAEVSAREASLEAGERASADGPQDDREPSPILLFVPGAAYALVAIEHGRLGRGDAVELDGEQYVVGRMGASPLPGDDRLCAYLVVGPRSAYSREASS